MNLKHTIKVWLAHVHKCEKELQFDRHHDYAPQNVPCTCRLSHINYLSLTLGPVFYYMCIVLATTYDGVEMVEILHIIEAANALFLAPRKLLLHTVLDRIC